MNTSSPSVAQRNPGPCDGFDTYSGQRWIYPNNLPIRGYQKKAVEMALFNNAMIVLPTGFGKTFIAAVVMYNFYLWYPQGKVIFVAPTKPLVAQQIQECRTISGIPKKDCIEMTGLLGTERRRNLWADKRVVFATPQVIDNDLESGLLCAKTVRCVVIDEAHRAQGGYSYVNIIKHLNIHNHDNFRVLALSATPGSDIQRVQQVMQNLLINEVMFRSENSIDLMQFRNEKSSKAWTVELSGKHKYFVDKFISITNPIFKELYRAGLTYSQDSIEKVARYTLIKAMNNGMAGGRMKYLCCAGVSLSSKFELLTIYGIRVFYASIMKSLSETRNPLKTCLAGKIDFDRMLDDIKAIFGEDAEPDPTKRPNVDLLQGHPKLVVVRDLLMKHFNENSGKKETRAIVFTKYRESVNDIVQTLLAYSPIIKPAVFVGQAGMSQKDQIELIKKFKAGELNVLVATCVAEEGLDIGEIDLIVCYDTSSSPISTTQRRGRTGRKRSGNVQTICTKGYEEKKLQKAGASRRQVEDQLYKKENYTAFRYREAPRMVPLNIHPVCIEHKIFPSVDDDAEEETPKRKNARKTPTIQTAEKLYTKKKKLKKDEEIKDGCDEVDSAKKKVIVVDEDEESWDDLWTLPPNLPKFED